MSRTRNGFTFVEVLVSMAVLGALSAIAVPRYRLLREKAWTATMKADLGELRIAEESHWAEHHRYSPDSSQLDWRATSGVTVVISSGDFAAGYQATARHASMPTSECSIFVGRETMPGIPSGDIICRPANGGGATAATPPAP